MLLCFLLYVIEELAGFLSPVKIMSFSYRYCKKYVAYIFFYLLILVYNLDE